jgi:hypothetical protein
VSVLRFESEEALRIAITSGLVPTSLVSSPARAWRDGGNAIFVAPLAVADADTLAELGRAGIAQMPDGADAAEPPERVGSWAEIVEVRPTGDVPGDVERVVFLVPAGESLVDLAGELLRLGCDRLEWRALAGGEFLLRAQSPPYYSLLRAVDGGAGSPHRGARAYVPSPPGQDRVYVELGFGHPLAKFLKPERGHSIFVSGRSRQLRCIPDGAYTDIYAILEVSVPLEHADDARPAMPVDAPPKLRVALRLARAATAAAPRLWVLRDRAVSRVEGLLASMPEEAAASVLFAAATIGTRDLMVLRARPGADASLEIEGEGYRPHAALPNLFLPCDATLEPPLRRQTIREVLAPEPDVVVWLRRTEGHDGAFVTESLPESAFLPLSEWVDYVVDTSAPALVPWIRSTTFDFEAFTLHDAPSPREETPAPRPEERRRTRREPQSPQAARDAGATRPPPPEHMAPRTLPEERRVDVVAAAAEEVAALEREFLSLDVAADHPARRALFERMAPCYAALGRGLDAALAWVRVVWEVAPAECAAARAAWADAESVPLGSPPLQSLLALEAPSPDQVRALAARLIAERGDVAAVAHDASRWLDRHDDPLDSRTAWLARCALSRAVGGDRLALARTRDRLLSRMHRGLSVQREVPSFLRLAGAGRDSAQVERLAARLESLLARFETTKRRRSATEADPALTAAYVRFVFAYAAARLGRVAWSTSLRDAASRAVPAGDPVHDYLTQAFGARVAQALDAMPAESPLPAAISGQLDALGKLDRYKVDRVRQCSKVLEPHERLDPIDAYRRGELDPRGPEFAGLRGEADGAVIAKGVAEILARARASEVDERARLLDGVMDFFPLLSHERATAHLEAVLESVGEIPPRRRAELLEEALMLAGHFGDERLARRIFSTLEPLVAGASAEGAAEIAPLVGGMLRTVRRVGLRDEAKRLLVAVQTAAGGGGTSHLVTRLHAAAGLACLGELEATRAVFDEAFAALARTLPMAERLVLTRATARALGFTPTEYAVAGLDLLPTKLDVVTDSFNTNTHVCLSVLDFMEGIVLGYASDELSLGPAGRRWLDDDEYLVRRRIHRDLEGWQV